MFDPVKIPDDACAEGHLDSDPIFGVLLALGQKLVTGRLTIADAAGDNHMYFMQGRPVGVHLAEHFHPLGQLLLEIGRLDGATFVRAQPLIAEGSRLPGQVYKELGVLDDAGLREVLSIQARRKAEHFCRLGSRPFVFCRGLTWLTGFTSTPLDPHAVIFLAVRQQMGEQSREGWLEAARGEQVRLMPPGGMPPEGTTVEHLGLPGAPQNFGFGAPEERFLHRLLAGFESVVDLAETGTLPRDEVAVLLRYLEVIGRLQRRPIPPKRDPLPLDDAEPNDIRPLLAPASDTLPGPVRSPFLADSVPTPMSMPSPLSSSSSPPPAVPARGAVPRHVTAVQSRAPELDALLLSPLAEPTSEDVFSKASAPVAPRPQDPFASPDAMTDPRQPAVNLEELMAPLPALPALPSLPSLADEPIVFASGGDMGLMAEPSIVLSDELPPPLVKKKKVKRSEPLPSEGSGLQVSETRHEKVMTSELPSIVIDDD